MNGIESAKRKVVRARQHLKSLDICASRYMESVTNLIVHEMDGTQKIRFSKRPPVRIAVLAGEIVYHLRSALDHIAFELVSSNPTNCALPKGWERKCRFPLCLEVPAKGNPPVLMPLPLRFNFFRETLPGITPEAFTEIEGLQPYNGGDGPVQLGWLEKLANIDKHRHLHVVIAQTYQTEHVRSGTIDSERIYRLHDGADVKPMLHDSGELEDTMYVQRGILSPFVTFDEKALPEELADVAVGNLFEVCIDVISRKVIPKFEAFV